MQFQVKTNKIYECSLERAFKTPLLCDVSLVHTGFGLMPRITHCTEDEQWGQIASGKKVFAAKSLTQKGGYISRDYIIDRQENKKWTFQVDDFQSWMLGFNKFVAEWKTTELAPNKILVEYTYHLHAQSPLLYPINWIFAKTFWKIYMNRVLKIVHHLAQENTPYLYA